MPKAHDKARFFRKARSSDAVTPPQYDDLTLLEGWAKRIDGCLQLNGEASPHWAMLFRPDQMAADAMMRLSLKYPHIIHQIQDHLDWTEKWFEPIEKRDGVTDRAREAFCSGMFSLMNRIRAGVKTIRETEAPDAKAEVTGATRIHLSTAERAYLRVLWDWKTRRYGDPDGPGDYYRYPDPIDPVPLYLIDNTLRQAGYADERIDDARKALLESRFIARAFVLNPCPRPREWKLPNGTKLRCDWMEKDPPELDLMIDGTRTSVIYNGGNAYCPECGSLLTAPPANSKARYTEDDYCPECRKSVAIRWGTVGYYLTEDKGEPYARELAYGEPGFDPFSVTTKVPALLADGKADARKRKGQQAVAKQEMERLDLISSAVAVQEFCVSRSTLKRAVARGKLRDYRPKNSPANAAYRLSRAEVAGQWPARI